MKQQYVLLGHLSKKNSQRIGKWFCSISFKYIVYTQFWWIIIFLLTNEKVERVGVWNEYM